MIETTREQDSTIGRISRMHNGQLAQIIEHPGIAEKVIVIVYGREARLDDAGTVHGGDVIARYIVGPAGAMWPIDPQQTPNERTPA
jgi:hypothetical protein